MSLLWYPPLVCPTPGSPARAAVPSLRGPRQVHPVVGQPVSGVSPEPSSLIYANSVFPDCLVACYDFLSEHDKGVSLVKEAGVLVL